MSEHRGKHIRSSEFARLSMFEEVLAEPMVCSTVGEEREMCMQEDSTWVFSDMKACSKSTSQQ